MSDSLGVEYGLLMPFVVVKSKGGPYEDGAYVAGYEAGRFDMFCGSLQGQENVPYPLALPNAYHASNMSQLDLIAMKHRLVAVFEDAGDGWILVKVSKDV